MFHSMAQLRLALGRTVARKYKEAVAANTAANPSSVHFMLVCPWQRSWHERLPWALCPNEAGAF